jgi:hypothetical protein
MIFVVYAGLVASMFPIYQEQCLKQAFEFEANLRTGRRPLYRWTDALTKLCEKARKAGDSPGKEIDLDAPADSCQRMSVGGLPPHVKSMFSSRRNCALRLP